MKAVVVERAGGPEVLEIRQLPRPEPKPGWVLIRVKAFGLNRSEMFTRQGHSPSVTFPRVLGIECVGVVEDAGGGALAPGQTVVAMMGGMGRVFDGGYAEYTLVPDPQVVAVANDLDWPVLGAIPETFQTAWGALTQCLDATAGASLLVRGGTSSVGMAAITLAKDWGLRIAATTRNPAKVDALREAGADHVLIDDGTIAAGLREVFPGGAQAILELVGTVTMADSLAAAAERGIVCMVGSLGDSWLLDGFNISAAIPTGVKLTTYHGEGLPAEALQEIIDGVAAGRYSAHLDRVFAFVDIVAAHRYMEENRATGKLVVVVD